MDDKVLLEGFHPIVRAWFTKSFREPSPPQRLGWPSISSGQHTLILAPTGSGKTLAAFLWAINHLVEQRLREDLSAGIRILYVSPLKALNNDIHRNLEEPLRGIAEEARTAGLRLPQIRTEVRTGDTPQAKRQAMLRHPPDILITTPESLYLMLTSTLARRMFSTVQYVILDEIHSVCGNKRGVHLSISLERLAQVADQEFVRVGLSATQRPLEHTAAFLGGQQWEEKRLIPRPVSIVDAGHKKQMDLRVLSPAPDFSLLPPDGVWPLVFDELLENIQAHTTTLIFVNNRRLAERVAAKLNEMITGDKDTFQLYAVPRNSGLSALGQDTHTRDIPRQPFTLPLVQAYHGSMSRAAREEMETDLKAGKLRALVATSSLELGIDIGSIDLVIQLQSPKGIARGLQRVGRSGHLMTATSKGRIFPTHREDLVESAVVAREMVDHHVEQTVIPQDCLDVLAQQIVAMVSVEEWDVDRLYDVVRQSYCYRNLSERAYTGVLQMLGGRYTHAAFRELRARISWDKANNRLLALPGSARLAITSGGTISDRGYYGVYLEDGKTKVGEVDEEFVFESRAGDTFILGSNIWRMREIGSNRITVSPAPGQPARMPFWRGEGIGRSYELGREVGAFRREMSIHAGASDCLAWLQREYPIDSRAAWNIQEYFRKQLGATGLIPDDRTLVLEGFRDDIGDPRIVIHSAFGRRVNGLLGLVASRRLQQRIGAEPQMLYNDDGILLRCSDVDVVPLELFEGLTTNEAQDLALEDILMSPLFGGQFRQNAARALLMPKASPGKRTPLWLQRLRAGDLLQIVRQFDDFPIVIETVREVLNDVLDFEHFKDLLLRLEQGTIRMKTVRTEIPSPFATSLLFDFVAGYMYEWDQPRADKLSQYLAINREILSEVVDLDTAKGLLRPEAVEVVEAQLSHSAEGYKARSPEELFEILLRVGDLTSEEIRARTVSGDISMAKELEADGRAVRIPLPGGNRWIAGEENSLYQDRNEEQHTRSLVQRYLQHRGPITSAEVAERYGLNPEAVDAALADLASQGDVTKGHFRAASDASADVIQWCFRPNLEKIHRQTIHILRKEITPSSLEEYTHFLHHWQELYPSRMQSGVEGLLHCMSKLQGIPIQSDIWEREVLTRRMREYSREHLLQLTATGQCVWVGASSGRMKVVQRGEGSVFLSPPTEELDRSIGEPASRILRYLREQGASFFNDIRMGTKLSLHAMNNGISELFWNGMITNDVFDELQNVRRISRLEDQVPLERVELTDPQHNPRKGRLMHTVRRAIKHVPGWSGRWSLVHLPGVMGEQLSEEEVARGQARQVLLRYGILARELFRREDLLPWGVIAGELQRMEMRGEIRRGYFVKGLSGMQFALPEAVEAMRQSRAESGEAIQLLLLNSCDPANPYGPGIELSTNATQTGAVRLTRLAGNYLIFSRGSPVLLIENYGSRLWSLSIRDPDVMYKGLQLFVSMLRLPPSLRPFREITIESVDGLRASESPAASMLRGLGFRRDQNQTMSYDGYA